MSSSGIRSGGSFILRLIQWLTRSARRAWPPDLTVILCVGESLEQREQGTAENVVSGQLSGGLSGLTASDLDRIIVAYEPVWAIGTGRTATPEQAQEMHAFIRRVFAERYSDRSCQRACEYSTEAR